MDFTAIGPSQWWLLGAISCSAGRCPAISETSDSGATWNAIPAPGAPYPAVGTNATSDNVAQLRFANAHDGWAFEPGLYATYNGGQTWTATNLGGAVEELEPGLGKVYAVVFPGPIPQTCNGASNNPCPTFQLWTAPIGSSSWSLDTAPGDIWGGLAVHGDDIYLLPAQDGGAVPGLLISTNQGASFTKSPNVGYGLGCQLSPVTDTVIWVFCATGNFGQASISTDGGMTFNHVNFGPEAPNSSHIAGASSTVAVAVSGGAGMPLEQTSDGGRTFVAVQAAPTATSQWDLIGFTNAEDGYAFSFDPATGAYPPWMLWHTADGGGHWAPLTIH